MVVAWLIVVAWWTVVAVVVFWLLVGAINFSVAEEADQLSKEKSSLESHAESLSQQNIALQHRLNECVAEERALNAALQDTNRELREENTATNMLLEQANNHQAEALRRLEKLEREYEDERKRHGASRRERDEYFGRVKELEAENQELRVSFDEHLAAHKGIKEELNAKCVSLQHQLNDVAAEKSKALEREKDALAMLAQERVQLSRLGSCLHEIYSKAQEVLE